MTDLACRADGIERAVAAGGVELEKYRRPGFTGEVAVRRSETGGAGSGIPVDWAGNIDPDPDEYAKRAKR